MNCLNANFGVQQRALVAVSKLEERAMIVHATCGIVFDVENGNLNASQLFEKTVPNKTCLYIWEGTAKRCDGKNGYVRMYAGKFRTLLPCEYEDAVRGNLFHCAYCTKVKVKNETGRNRKSLCR